MQREEQKRGSLRGGSSRTFGKGKESVMEGVEPNDEMESDLDGEEATAVADI